MAAPRIRRVQTPREFETVRDDFITQGYEVLREGEGTALMRKSTWGSTGTHVLIALFTAWWTVGIANLVYAMVRPQRRGSGNAETRSSRVTGRAGGSAGRS